MLFRYTEHLQAKLCAKARLALSCASEARGRPLGDEELN
jgi:hypothetical protein